MPRIRYQPPIDTDTDQGQGREDSFALRDVKHGATNPCTRMRNPDWTAAWRSSSICCRSPDRTSSSATSSQKAPQSKSKAEADLLELMRADRLVLNKRLAEQSAVDLEAAEEHIARYGSRAS
jgi:hypothetical protein